MTFEMRLTQEIALGAVTDLDGALRDFLGRIGYLRGEEDTEESVAYRLAKDCFIVGSGWTWSVDEMLVFLSTSRPTLYRHLNRLKSLNLIEEVSLGPERGNARKGYRLRYGNLSKAWDFAEADAAITLNAYRENIDHIQKLVDARTGMA